MGRREQRAAGRRRRGARQHGVGCRLVADVWGVIAGERVRSVAADSAAERAAVWWVGTMVWQKHYCGDVNDDGSIDLFISFF